jgi:parallel beta-helix repeat protein
VQATILVKTPGAEGMAVLEDLKINGGAHAIKMEPVHNFGIRRNLIVNASNSAIRVGEATDILPFTGYIEDNVMRDVGKGIELAKANEGVAIRGNIISTQSQGVSVKDSSGLSLLDNYVFNSGALGSILLTDSDSCTIANNRATGNAGSQDGLTLIRTTGCLISENVFNGHGEEGIRLAATSDGNTLERNVTNGNGGFGLALDCSSRDNRYGRNSATGHSGNSVNLGGPGGACNNPGPLTCGWPNFCNETACAPSVGTNPSFGDNLIPGPPPC